ncbi:uncharacterized protein LOC133723253 [Rosa rugosa]|uniref:uncharacterized protein LOC133723253 n=1 Tax=Rosa rugosa TaxID=74645 RepID=UPI002B412B66|nr:uncharacterized protein LOC133723253 [Rosa rugosa]
MEELNNWLLQRQQESTEDIERIQATNAQLVATLAEYDSSDPPRGRGSRHGHARNVERHKESGGQCLMEDYFIEYPIFEEVEFRRRYRMRRSVFNRIMESLCNHDRFWHQKPDCSGKMGLLPQQKMTGALRRLAYGAAADQCIEITKMGESTTLECLKKFCQQVEALYSEWYLRTPTPWRPTTHGYGMAFFGTPEAQNDINVLGQSKVFQRVISGSAPSVTFKANDITFSNPYYLADGIYPRWSTFVKTILNPRGFAEKLFAKKQEAYRKDVERCFGILQARFAILRHGARLFKLSTLRSIMISCIILYNMIVEDEFVEDDFIEPNEIDNMNPEGANVYDRPLDREGRPIPFQPVERDGQNLPQLIDRVEQLHSAYLHKTLQDALVVHNWNLAADKE